MANAQPTFLPRWPPLLAVRFFKVFGYEGSKFIKVSKIA